MLYGFTTPLWFQDELQIYLIGLKSFTTGTWPFYGPDLVYTNTQIPGALQGLLVSFAFYIVKIPEAPMIFLGLLSFGSLSLLAYYITRRITSIPPWIVWLIVMTTPWTMYATRIVNPSYALVFSIPFFVCMLDLIPIHKTTIINPKIGFLIVGATTTLIMQLHMSWVLLIPFTGLVFLTKFRSDIKEQLLNMGIYSFGLFIGALTLFPTLLYPQSQGEELGSNIVLNPDNWTNFPIILLRFLSFASNEIVYFMGSSTTNRLKVFYEQIWMAPVVIFLLTIGLMQVGLFVLSLFKKSTSESFVRMKKLVIGSVILIYASFFFSIKGPSSHTFYIVLPIALYYSFYCYEWIIEKKQYALVVLKIMAISCMVFHIGLGLYNYEHNSLYVDRNKIQEALTQMDYTIVGKRRSDEWGYGY